MNTLRSAAHTPALADPLVFSSRILPSPPNANIPDHMNGRLLLKQVENIRWRVSVFMQQLNHRSAYPGRLRLAVFLALLDAFQLERLHFLVDRGIGAIQVSSNLRYQRDPCPLAQVGFFGCCPWFEGQD